MLITCFMEIIYVHTKITDNINLKNLNSGDMTMYGKYVIDEDHISISLQNISYIWNVTVLTYNHLVN